jgi:GAF domain-containing protein
MSATPDSTFTSPEQRIAALERQCQAERDEYKVERDQALQRETATAEVLQVINSSPGDLAPVFDTILEKATQLCEASFGVLRTWDGERFHVVAAQGEPEFTEWVRGYGPFAPADPSSPAGRIVSGEEVVRFADAPEEEALSISPGFRALVESSGMRSGVNVALRKDGTLRGNITVFHQEVRPFTDKQIALLQNFAAQAVIAMENARLLTETREALEQQTATAEVLQVINSSPGDLAPVFDVMLEKAMSLCGAIFGELHTYDGVSFKTSAGRGHSTAFAEARVKNPPAARPGTASARILETKRPVHILDIKAEESYRDRSPASRALIDLGGTRTTLGVPLLKNDTVLGFISFHRDEVKPFTDRQIALLQNFAAQAVIAMENARLLTETREALEQQTATAEVLQVINSSPGDLAPVFDAMLEKAIRLCESSFGALRRFDGKMFWAIAVRDASGAAGKIAHEPVVPDPGSASERIVQGESVVHIPDLVDTEEYRSGVVSRLIAVEKLGARTGLWVALRKDDLLVGDFVIYRKEVRPFTAKQIALLQNFAAQAVIAMENARLLTETREALDQQTATAEVLQVINSSPGDLAPVFDAILEKALRLCEANLGNVLTYDGERFAAAATRGNPQFDHWLRGIGAVLPEAGSTNERIVRGESIIEIRDLADDPASKPKNPIRRALIEIGGFRTSLSIALRKEQSLLGVLHIYRQEVRRFSEKELALLRNFAAQAVVAMENARLLGELRQRTDEVAELNRGLEARIAEQVEELGRVGRLKRFLAPQLAELIVSQGDEKILESHRREIVVVFCDLRGYTAFTETAEPEEVLDFLREYHGALGPLVSQFEGTLDQFSGDGIMVFFNDPVPCPDPAERAVKMATAMREAAGKLIASWRRRGRLLGFGAGIAQGYATLGQIGFAERSGYTAIGTVCNLAARLCAEAQDGQILIGQRVAVAVEETITLEEVGSLTLKGLTQPVVAYNVPLAASQPALRVIEGGPQSV